ncbi:MAG: TonB-dependent receptor [bacterium]|nr:TonB-dependent receptor [bacterium]
MNKLLFSLWISLIIFPVGIIYTAEIGKVFGCVIDRETSEPIPYAQVLVVDENLRAVTDENGFYLIYNVPFGRHTLKVNQTGYEELIKEIKVNGAEKRIDIGLKKRIIYLPEIEVLEKRYLPRSEGITVSDYFLKEEEIENIAGEVGDVTRVITILPGVNKVDDFTSLFSCRGGDPSENLILVDKIPLLSPYHMKYGGGIFSIVNPSMVNDLKLITGGFPAEYGGHVSSVLDIRYKEGDKDGYDGKGEVNFITSCLSLEGPIFRRWSFATSYRRSFFDVLLKKLFEIEEGIYISLFL